MLKIIHEIQIKQKGTIKKSNEIRRRVFGKNEYLK